eukprot:TRINITY_DN36232_c0_g1_i1.p1 TRINITY_DN36232_c0_g1~~TRINITY_DN36232_c0_g1_i1.p1  ORF type:complete len:627 (-),score=157.30 TRINITY_DN36232_c0_g1_i1:184-2007(-)
MASVVEAIRQSRTNSQQQQQSSENSRSSSAGASDTQVIATGIFSSPTGSRKTRLKTRTTAGSTNSERRHSDENDSTRAPTEFAPSPSVNVSADHPQEHASLLGIAPPPLLSSLNPVSENSPANSIKIESKSDGQSGELPFTSPSKQSIAEVDPVSLEVIPVIPSESVKQFSMKTSLDNNKKQPQKKKKHQRNHSSDRYELGLEFGFNRDLRKSVARLEENTALYDEDRAQTNSGEHKSDGSGSRPRSLSDGQMKVKPRLAHVPEKQEDHGKFLVKLIPGFLKNRSSQPREESEVEESRGLDFNFAQKLQREVSGTAPAESHRKDSCHDADTQHVEKGIDLNFPSKLRDEIKKEEHNSVAVATSAAEEEEPSQFGIEFGFASEAKKTAACQEPSRSTRKSRNDDNENSTSHLLKKTSDRENSVSSSFVQKEKDRHLHVVRDSADFNLDFNFVDLVKKSAERYSTQACETEDASGTDTKVDALQSNIGGLKVEKRDEAHINPDEEVWVFDFEQEKGHWNTEDSKVSAAKRATFETQDDFQLQHEPRSISRSINQDNRRPKEAPDILSRTTGTLRERKTNSRKDVEEAGTMKKFLDMFHKSPTASKKKRH